MPTKKKPRKSYSEEFKRKAVLLSRQPGAKVGDVADQLGINPQYLSKWRSEAAKALHRSDIESELTATAENKRLREELRQARMEVEILKKAASYFASQG